MEKPIIYQVFTRLFGNDCVATFQNGDKETNGCGTMADFTNKALNEIKGLGITHIWYTGLLEHATQTDYTKYGIIKDHPAIVKGKAGSPYAVKDYYDIDPDLAVKVPERLKEFKNLVNRTHKAGLKVIMDFVPNHVARQYHSDAKPAGVKDLGEMDNLEFSFLPNNNFYYYPGHQLTGIDMNAGEDTPYVEKPAKASGNDVFGYWVSRNDWYETVKLNYGRDYSIDHNYFTPIPDTWHKMHDILLYWTAMGVDGFRCDMAEMVPVEFWGWIIPQIKEKNPDIIFIAEIYNPVSYRNYIYHGKFDYLYDKVGLYDTLRSVACNQTSASNLTGCWQNVTDIQDHMLNFLENHDEQRIGSNYFLGAGIKAKAAMTVTATLFRNPVMIYFGQELGERGMDNEGFSGIDGRTTIFDYWTVDTIRRWRNKGKFDGALLKPQEIELREFYKKLLTICNQEPAIREGEMFDLMYVNYGGWMLNDQRHYAYLRKKDDNVVLIVANFSNSDARIGVKIPEHAFKYLNMNHKAEAPGVDLLTGTQNVYQFLPEKICTVDVKANNSVIIKLNLL